ncbi:MAG TPA: MBL fold metallo-hydrolase [Sphingobium sp.]|nr:MBL fold metallo-hydrolase [Sphingobium sp.]
MNRWMHVVRGLALASALALCAPGGAAFARADESAPLKVILVDVEGGAATLYVTPQGHSLLIDAGWPTGVGGPRPEPGKPAPAPLDGPARIVAAAKAAGLSRIDYLVITHYHVDHVGGLADLLKLIPVGAIIDHGPNREMPSGDASPAMQRFAPATLYPAYLEAIAGLPRRSMKAGETLRIDDLDLTAVVSDKAVIAKPLPGAGKAGTGCAEATSKAEDGGEENARSLGFLMRWGEARLLALGDTTWDVENRLVCPVNRIGTVDFYIADNHGSDTSNSPTFLNNIRPRITVINNGPRKGADAAVFDTVRAAPGREALWQLHSAERSPDKNEPDDRIINLAGGEDGRSLEIEVARDAALTVINTRTGHRETYRRHP